MFSFLKLATIIKNWNQKLRHRAFHHFSQNYMLYSLQTLNGASACKNRRKMRTRKSARRARAKLREALEPLPYEWTVGWRIPDEILICPADRILSFSKFGLSNYSPGRKGVQKFSSIGDDLEKLWSKVCVHWFFLKKTIFFFFFTCVPHSGPFIGGFVQRLIQAQRS